MTDLPQPSRLPDPSDRLETEAWLERRSEKLADAIARSLKKVVTSAYEKFLRTLPETSIVSSLTAAGDMSAFDGIVGEWRIIFDREIVPELEETYLSGAMSAFVQSPGSEEMTQSEVESWARVTNDQAVQYMSEATNRLVGVGDTIWNDVRSRVTDAVASGMSNEDLKGEIEKLSNFSEYRADTIARTETISAYVNGDWEGAQLLGEYGPVEKVWVATGDARGREWHTELMDTSLPMDEPFDVDGEPMLYPHDPSGSAYNVVNCRCYVEFLYAGDTRPDGSIVPEPGSREAAIEAGEEIVEEEETPVGIEPGLLSQRTFEETVDLPSASRGAAKERVEGLREVLTEIDSLHGLPADGLPNVKVRLGGQTQNKGGHFTPGTRGPAPRRVRGQSFAEYQAKVAEYNARPLTPEILITDRGKGIAEQMGSMAHELGHRVDWNPGVHGFNTERAYALEGLELQAKYKAAWWDYIDEARTEEGRAILRLAKIVRDSPETARLLQGQTVAYKQYFTSVVEVWARAYHQWVAMSTGNPRLVASIREMQRIGYAMSDADFELARPHIESLLRSWGLIK